MSYTLVDSSSLFVSAISSPQPQMGSAMNPSHTGLCVSPAMMRFLHDSSERLLSCSLHHLHDLHERKFDPVHCHDSRFITGY